MGKVSWLRLFLWTILVWGLFFLAACSGAPEMVIETVEVTEEAEVVVTEVVVEEVEVIVTEVVVEEPAPAETAEPGALPSPTWPPSPVPQPTSLPATQEIIPTVIPSTPVIEQRMVELEWPPRLRLGDSDFVRLTLLPVDDGYTVTTEFSDHQTITQTVQMQQESGYELAAVARLDGVAFEISPAEAQEYSLVPGQAVTWRWSLQPHQAGQQRLSLTLLLRWIPTSASGLLPRETVAYSRSLEVQVVSFFGLTRGQAMTGGLLGLFFGSGLSVVALTGIGQPARAVLRVLDPNPALVLEPRPDLKLTNGEAGLLRALFGRYARLVLESEFLSGYSGARTFLVQPIRLDGRADAYTIVKIGQPGSIQREFANYEAHVKDTLPPITARIQHVPVVLRGGDRAAVQYTFIAEPGRLPTSLRRALLADPDPHLLFKLFETFGPNWWMQRRAETFRLGREYDRVLPTHYVIEPASGRGRLLDGSSSPSVVGPAVGELVTLRNFTQRERRLDGVSLSLLGEPPAGQPPLRVRWLSLSEPNGATGRVVATRRTLLDEFAAGMERFGLPDPLEGLTALLDTSVAGTRSTIHGDLNLENVLVGPGDFVWLIDFAQTRDGHPLFDFAHLESEIITQVIAPQIPALQDYLALIQGHPKAEYAHLAVLRNAVQEIAGRCLFNPSQPGEYTLALKMACLGALKFTNLDAHQKHLLYLTAAGL
jgi:hypothetical protein